MKQLKRPRSWHVLMFAGFATLAASPADAAILGFNGLNGWQPNRTDSATPIQIVDNNTIQFTAGPNNRRSIWNTTPQDISQFEANFTYRASSIAASVVLQGITFSLQNSAAGTAALGGAIFGFDGISPSASVTLETDTGPGRTYTGFYQNGIYGQGSENTAPVNAFDFSPIDVNIRYNGSVLSVTMTQGDLVFGPRNHVVGSLAALLGSPTAYVGFTASTANTLGSGGGATQFLSNFSFVPEPGTGLAMLIGLAGLRRAARQVV